MLLSESPVWSGGPLSYALWHPGFTLTGAFYVFCKGVCFNTTVGDRILVGYMQQQKNTPLFLDHGIKWPLPVIKCECKDPIPSNVCNKYVSILLRWQLYHLQSVTLEYLYCILWELSCMLICWSIKSKFYMLN